MGSRYGKVGFVFDIYGFFIRIDRRLIRVLWEFFRMVEGLGRICLLFIGK